MRGYERDGYRAKEGIEGRESCGFSVYADGLCSELLSELGCETFCPFGYTSSGANTSHHRTK